MPVEDARLPVIVGVGQVRANRDRTAADAREPLALILDALDAAAKDADTPGLLAAADAVYAVRVASWAYDELSATVAAQVGAEAKHRVDSPIGGQWPIRLLDAAAARIAAGESEIALLVGGEAAASASALLKSGLDPVADRGWSSAPGGPAPLDPNDFGSAAMQAAGLFLPTRVYPLFENRLQADLGLTPAEGAAWSARLYADLSAVAATNPVAWNPVALSPDDVGTVTSGNRMVCEPYPLSVNALPFVDQAAAVIVTSLAAARRWGIPDDAVVHLHASAGADDALDFLARADLGSSAALTMTLQETLERGAVTAEELDFVDIYSCFPVVPKLAGMALGLSRDAVLSVTGGHSAFGGPLNSYSLHSLASAVERLRAGGSWGLVHANGGFMTYQHAVLLGTRPAEGGYVSGPVRVLEPSLPVIDAVRLATVGGTPVVVEAATVEHGRDGSPAQAFVVVQAYSRTRAALATPVGDVRSAAAWSLEGSGLRTHSGRRAMLTLVDGAPTLTTE